MRFQYYVRHIRGSHTNPAFQKKYRYSTCIPRLYSSSPLKPDNLSRVCFPCVHLLPLIFCLIVYGASGPPVCTFPPSVCRGLCLNVWSRQHFPRRQRTVRYAKSPVFISFCTVPRDPFLSDSFLAFVFGLVHRALLSPLLQLVIRRTYNI